MNILRDLPSTQHAQIAGCSVLLIQTGTHLNKCRLHDMAALQSTQVCYCYHIPSSYWCIIIWVCSKSGLHSCTLARYLISCKEAVAQARSTTGRQPTLTHIENNLGAQPKKICPKESKVLSAFLTCTHSMCFVRCGYNTLVLCQHRLRTIPVTWNKSSMATNG